MHIQYRATYLQIDPKYIYKDLRFHPYSTSIHATACSTETVGLKFTAPWQPDFKLARPGGRQASLSESRLGPDKLGFDATRMKVNIHSDYRCIMMNEMILQWHVKT
jgi:hypothetical protein